MKKYPAENWERLGRWVYEARHQAGFSDTKVWAEAASRSSRMLLGLERGEPVGAGTLQAVADALGVAAWGVFARLSDPDAVENLGDLEAHEVQRLRDDYTAETGKEVEDFEILGLPLRQVSNEDLLAEVARRMNGEGKLNPWIDPAPPKLSDPSSRNDHLRAADNRESSISGEQLEPDTP